MDLTNDIKPEVDDNQLPLLQAAQGMVDTKDGKGIGDLVNPNLLASWVHDFLIGRGDPLDQQGMAIAFRFGVKADGRYAGQSFVETESQLRADWAAEKCHIPWDKVREAVWAGFDRARDRRF